MILVADTNRIIAALIKDSTARHILMSAKLDFVSLSFGRREIYKYRDEILNKANVNGEEFEKLVRLLFGKILVLDDEVIEEHMGEAKEIMDKIDPSDTPFIACALAIRADGIFTEDRHFDKQTAIKVYKTKDILQLL